MRTQTSNQIAKNDSGFNKYILNEHNRLRQLHGVPDLKLDDKLSKGCQAYAEELAVKDKMDHSNEAKTGEFGENLAAMQNDPRTCVQLWYDEIELYNFKKGEYSTKTGHFTAVVWKATTHLGVGHKKNEASKKVYVVARYLPPGNVIGQFIENVPKPLNSTCRSGNLNEFTFGLVLIFAWLLNKFLA
ncbi:uncharacterized protein Dwil_GK27574 [Drosophila willistoni]|uniref:SCP domain-containing protein n=1 Tax=Drosophila willistoni TaxID=7260 RepID=A0A0Q9WSR0_DROWI|nr:uncharacterized protein Dwil_GK27574 [Drosophila willistoni]